VDRLSTTQDHVGVIDTTVQKTYTWIKDLSAELGGLGRRESFDILRAFLHTLRDRLTVDEAAQLGAQLPLLLRGAYYEGWDPSKTPAKLSREEFVERFARRTALKEPIDPERALRAAAKAARRHISAGEYEDVLAGMPTDLRRLLEV
jgi:uncharacterized protein (DUF2267 family)